MSEWIKVLDAADDEVEFPHPDGFCPRCETPREGCEGEFDDKAHIAWFCTTCGHHWLQPIDEA